MLHSLQVTGRGVGNVPEVGLVLIELRRLGYDLPDHAVHYGTFVMTPVSSSLRLAWSGPELRGSIVQQISRGFASARFDLGKSSVADDVEVSRETFVNGADVNKVFAASAEGEKEQ